MRLAPLILCLLALPLSAATYYVDFDAGSDANNGTTTGTAWKHDPGDANATGTAAATTLAAGDTVIFKGGVRYRGAIAVEQSGSDGSPIIYDGNTAGDWGTGKAIIDGSVLITTEWTPCANQADCRDNPNWANIYYTSIPAGVSNGWPQILINGTNQTHTAQHPNPTNRFLFDITALWTEMTPSQVTTTTITDTSYFTQSSATYWDEAWVGIWISGNLVVFRPITAFDTGTDTITFAATDPYEDRNSFYSVFNHPGLIDQAGEHAVSTNENRIYLWPPAGIDPNANDLSVGQKPSGFSGSTKANITVQGFQFVGQFSTVDAVGYNGAVILTPNVLTGRDVRNVSLVGNDVRFVKSMDRDWLLVAQSGDNASISNNAVTYSFGGGVFTALATNNLISSNVFAFLTGTAIYTPGVTNSFILRNTLDTILGAHANGISVYSAAKDVLISRNKLRNIITPITYQESSGLTFSLNLVDAMNSDQHINDWGSCFGNISWVGNTLVNCSTHFVLNIGTSVATVTYDVRNNIIDGGGSFADQDAAASYNIYVGRAFNNAPLGTGESTNTMAALFVSPSTGDWRLKSGSPAIGAGTDLSAIYTTDIAGNAITGTYPIGAYATVPRIWTITTFNAVSANAGGSQ